MNCSGNRSYRSYRSSVRDVNYGKWFLRQRSHEAAGVSSSVTNSGVRSTLEAIVLYAKHRHTLAWLITPNPSLWWFQNAFVAPPLCSSVCPLHLRLFVTSGAFLCMVPFLARVAIWCSAGFGAMCGFSTKRKASSRSTASLSSKGEW